MITRYSIYIFLFILICLSGCSGYSMTGGPGSNVPQAAQTEVTNSKELLAVQKVYLAPLTFDPSIKNQLALQDILSAHVVKALKNQVDFEVLHTASKMETYKGTDLQSMLKAARQEAVSAGADAVVALNIQQYVERVGNSAAAEQPARVSFTMSLHSLESNEVIWKASYIFRDEALSDNLLRLGQRVNEVNNDGRRGWWTALQLFERGVSDLSKKLYQSKTGQYLVKSNS